MKNTINEFRNEINKIDQQILELLNKRANCAIEIGKLKQSKSVVYVPSRESEVINSVVTSNNGPLLKQDITNIYREIISSCRGLEAKLKVSYLGPEATFSHQAALKLLGSKVDLVPAKKLTSVIEEAEKGNVDLAVVPVENSTEGPINTTLDELVDTDLKVVNEINLKVSQCLLSKTSFENIKIVYSHQQPIAQCSNWLKMNLPNAEISPVNSTAQAAKLATQTENSAAIASELAAEIYGLNVLKTGIQDSKDNWTRFFVLGRNEAGRTGNDKTSIVFTIEDRVRALYDILSVFSKNNINLTKIESRPTKKKVWQYIFFIDFNGHILDENVAKTILDVKKNCIFLKVLGSYPKAD